MQIIIIASFSYFLGTIPTAYLMVKRLKNDDIRNLGSGNIGASNAGRLLGTNVFLIVLVGDALKGAIAVWISNMIDPSINMAMLSLIFVVIGHIWPFYLNFRGGKGLSTSFGALLVFDFRIIIFFFIIALIPLLMFRKINIYALLGILALPLISAYLGYENIVSIVFVFLSSLIIFAHRDNIDLHFNDQKSSR